MASANENITLNGTDQDEILVTFGGDDTINAKGGNDRLNSGPGDDILLGADPVTSGANEQDSLSGGIGSDRFILGDTIHAFYASAGDQDFAIIEDFQTGIDRVTLTGRANEYKQVVQGNDTYLYCRGFGDKPDELLAIFKNVQGLDLNSSSFEFVIDPNHPPQGFIGNRVFLDENSNGILDSNEGGFSGAQVTLTEAGADGVFDTADDVVRQQTTGEGGYYGFGNLEAGAYKITVDNLPNDVELTQVNVGNREDLDSDINPETGISEVIQLAPDEWRNDIDAGVVSRVVNGFDSNPNDFDILREAIAAAGLSEALNDPQADITLLAPVDAAFIQLAQDFGYTGNDEAEAFQQIVTTLTDLGGSDPLPRLRDILLYHVSPGAKSQSEIENLEVVETLLGGATIRPEGDRLIDNEPDLIDPSFIPNLTDVRVQNGLIQGINRVLIPLDIPGNGTEPVDPQTGFIGNRIFLDENGNGLMDDGESGIGGARVTLTGAGADGQFDTADDITRTQDISSTEGYYGFDKLAAGQYKLNFTNLPEGLAFTQANVGDNDQIDSDVDGSNGMTSVIDLATGEFNATVDAGLVKQEPVDPKTGFIGNRVFLDENGNGLFDSGEGGIAGARATLTGAGADGQFGTDDDLIRIQEITSEAGYYGFDKLAAGQYKVTFDNLPDGFALTQQNAGNNQAFDSDANPSTGMTDIVALAIGEFRADIDAGLVQKPAPIDYSVQLVGDRNIREGGQGTYFVELNEVSDRDRTIILDIQNGSAQRRDGDITGQDVNGASFGGYSVGYNADNILYYVYDRVPNGTALSTGDRPQVGPSAQNWDFNVTQNGQINIGNRIEVTIAAGETRSDSFQVNAAKEKVTIDRFLTPHGDNKNAIEGAENFSIKIADAGDADITTGSLTVNIKDQTDYAYVSPITFDLNGNGIQTLSIDQGVTFDMLNSGTAVNTGWISGQDGFLALDANGNGIIDDRSELFGGNVGEGFAKLDSFDSNGDGVVDTADANFGALQLWQDINENGFTDQGELISLEAAGLGSLQTGYSNVFRTDAQGNIHGEHSTAVLNGNAIDMVDVYFQIG